MSREGGGERRGGKKGEGGERRGEDRLYLPDCESRYRNGFAITVASDRSLSNTNPMTGRPVKMTLYDIRHNELKNVVPESSV